MRLEIDIHFVFVSYSISHCSIGIDSQSHTEGKEDFEINEHRAMERIHYEQIPRAVRAVRVVLQLRVERTCPMSNSPMGASPALFTQ